MSPWELWSLDGYSEVSPSGVKGQAFKAATITSHWMWAGLSKVMLFRGDCCCLRPACVQCFLQSSRVVEIVHQAPITLVSHGGNASFREWKAIWVTRPLKTLLPGYTQKSLADVSKRPHWRRNPNEGPHELQIQSIQRKGKEKGVERRGKEGKRKAQDTVNKPNMLINRAVWTMGTASPWDTTRMNLSAIRIVARATIPGQRLRKHNGWKSRHLTPSFLRKCQCLSRVLSSHTELNALYITGLGMSGQESTFCIRLHRSHQCYTEHLSLCPW